MSVQLAPSILSADFSDLGRDVKLIGDSGADLVHVDIMDGHFVPNLTFGMKVIESVNGVGTVPFDIHLMVESPLDYVEAASKFNTKYIVVHQEACTHLDRVINVIKDKNILAGVALNPATPINTLESIIEEIDLVLIMTVNPGFGGQKFISYSYEKIRDLVSLREKKGLDFKIEIDGGVSLENVKALKNAGVDIMVAGSAYFNAVDKYAFVKEFKERTT